MSNLKWYHCPICGQKIFQIDTNARAEGIYVKCKKCKNIIEVRLEPKLEPEPVSVR